MGRDCCNAFKNNFRDKPVAIPDIIKKMIFCLDKMAMPFVSPLAKTIPQATIKIIMVRMAVAKFELTPVIPILAKMAVSEANKAESKAYIHHIINI
jgi:hypothetical protein